MVVNDPISEMFARMNNAIKVRFKSVRVPFSKMKFEMIKILKKEGFIRKYEIKDDGPAKVMDIDLAYDDAGISVISRMLRVSKPGRRTYARSRKIQRVLDGFGIAIISTSQGLMVDREARSKKLGGEVIAQVY